MNSYVKDTRGFLVGNTLDGQEHRLPPDVFNRHIAITATPGEGKTSIMTEAVRYLSLGPSPMVILDYVGTLFRALLLSVAHEASSLSLSTFYPSTGEAAARAHLARYAFSQPDDMGAIVGIDLLRPVPLPGGRRESFGMVASRVLEGFSFENPEVRVRFAKYATAIIILLSAGRRPITEWEPLLEGVTPYLRRLREFHALYGVADNTEVMHSWHRIGQLHDMSDFSKRTHMDSTESAFEPFTDPAVGSFFSVGNVKLEDILFGDKRLVVSVDQIPGFNKADLLFSMLLKSILHLGRKRDKDVLPPLVAFADEVGWIDHQELERGLELARNFGVSMCFSRQHYDAHFKDDRTAKLIDACAGTLIDFPQMNEAAMKRLVPTFQKVGPDDLWVMRDVLSSSRSRGKSSSDTTSDNWTDQNSRSVSRAATSFLSPDTPDKETTHFNAEGEKTGRTTTPGYLGKLQRHDAETESEIEGGSVGGGTSHNDGTSEGWTETVTHQPFRIPVSEQKEIIADEMQRADEYNFFLTRKRKTVQLVGVKERSFARFVRLSTGIKDIVADALDTMMEILGKGVERDDITPEPLPTPPTAPEPPDPRDNKPPLKLNGKPTGRHDRPKKKGGG